MNLTELDVAEFRWASDVKFRAANQRRAACQFSPFQSSALTTAPTAQVCSSRDGSAAAHVGDQMAR